MNCSELDQALISTPVPLPPEARDHTRDCKRCRDLIRILETPDPELQPSALHRIAQAMLDDLQPVRPLISRSRALGVLALIFAAPAGFGIWRMGTYALSVMTLLQSTVILGGFAIAAGMVASSLVQQMAPGSRYRILPELLPAIVLVSLAFAIGFVFRLHNQQHFWVRSWGCLRDGMSIAALGSVPVWLFLRRGTILSPLTTGAAAGLFAGLAGAAAMQVHCPNLNAWHVLVAHLGIALVGTLAGMACGLGNWVRFFISSPAPAKIPP